MTRRKRSAPPKTPPVFFLPEKVLDIRMPGTLPMDPDELVDLQAFLKAVVFRAGVGNVRYGPPATRKKYMTRMGKELKAYQKTGNAEHLLNIAVYCWLETMAPEHKSQHWDSTVESVTRGEMGGNIA
jgi:hypothetical protein